MGMIILGLLGFGAIVGLVGGILSWSYRSRILKLEWELNKLRHLIQTNREEGSVVSQDVATTEAVFAADPPLSTPPTAIPETEIESRSTHDVPKKLPLATEVAFAHLKQHWMIWLGGICIGLAGVFLVRYSIEQGLLGPGARILLALGAGTSLHGVAEWLRRKTGERVAVENVCVWPR